MPVVEVTTSAVPVVEVATSAVLLVEVTTSAVLLVEVTTSAVLLCRTRDRIDSALSVKYSSCTTDNADSTVLDEFLSP